MMSIRDRGVGHRDHRGQLARRTDIAQQTDRCGVDRRAGPQMDDHDRSRRGTDRQHIGRRAAVAWCQYGKTADAGRAHGGKGQGRARQVDVRLRERGQRNSCPNQDDQGGEQDRSGAQGGSSRVG
jgi:hypothetical protein